MSRVISLEGPPRGAFSAGNTAEVAYDVPPDAWFFDVAPWRTMPFAVLLEIGLQPCGWMSAFTGSCLQSDDRLFYRNLGGEGVVHRCVGPDVGTLVNKTTMTKLSMAGGMIILDFDFHVRDSEGPVFDATTTFGFFPAKALAVQVGVPTSAERRAKFLEPCPAMPDGRALPLPIAPRHGEGTLALPDEMLMMVSNVTGYWPEGGEAGLGRIRVDKPVDADAWFFKAHFFEDPVQPGSLGIEMMIQALTWLAIEKGLYPKGTKLAPLALGADMKWIYRGQVTPFTKRAECDAEILSFEDGVLRADASLWIDGMHIYHCPEIALGPA